MGKIQFGDAIELGDRNRQQNTHLQVSNCYLTKFSKPYIKPFRVSKYGNGIDIFKNIQINNEDNA